jgi:O-antigen ligase
MKWIHVPDESLLLYTPHLLLMFYYTLNACINNIDIHIGYVMSFFALYYIFSDVFLYQITKKRTFVSVLKTYYLLHIIYFIIDLSYRIYGVVSGKVVVSWIENAKSIYLVYLFKFHGVYGDANEIGVIAVIIFSVAFFQYKYGIITKKYVILNFIFVILTISRAAIIAAIFLVLFYNVFYKNSVFIKFFSIGILFMILLLVFFIFSNDASFGTKVDIYQKTLNYLVNPVFPENLTGLGANRSVSVFGRYAHNIYSIMIVEYGLIGFFLFFGVIFSMVIDCRRNIFYVLLPYFIVAASFTPITLPFLYCGISVIKHTNRVFNISFRSYQKRSLCAF